MQRLCRLRNRAVKLRIDAQHLHRLRQLLRRKLPEHARKQLLLFTLRHHCHHQIEIQLVVAADRMLRVARGLPAGDLRVAQRLAHLRKPRCAASDTGGECAAVRCHQTPQQFLHARLCLRKLVAIEQQVQAVSDADRLLMVSMLVQNTLRVALDALKLLVVMLRLIEKRDGADDPRFLHGNAERTSLFLKVVVVLRSLIEQPLKQEHIPLLIKIGLFLILARLRDAYLQKLADESGNQLYLGRNAGDADHTDARAVDDNWVIDPMQHARHVVGVLNDQLVLIGV